MSELYSLKGASTSVSARAGEAEFENRFLRMYMVEDGIVMCEYKTHRIDLKIAKELVERRLQFFKGRKLATIIDASTVNTVTQEARDYMAGREATENVTAAALIATNKIAEMLASFFISFNSPDIPLSLAPDKDAALKWLRERNGKK